MSEKNGRQILIEKIHKTVDRIIANTQISEEEKVQIFQDALRLIENPVNQEVVQCQIKC